MCRYRGTRKRAVGESTEAPGGSSSFLALLEENPGSAPQSAAIPTRSLLDQQKG